MLGRLRKAQTLPDASGTVEITLSGFSDDLMICLADMLRATSADDAATRLARAETFVAAASDGNVAPAAAAAAASKDCNSDSFVITIVTGEHELPGM